MIDFQTFVIYLLLAIVSFSLYYKYRNTEQTTPLLSHKDQNSNSSQPTNTTLKKRKMVAIEDEDNDMVDISSTITKIGGNSNSVPEVIENTDDIKMVDNSSPPLKKRKLVKKLALQSIEIDIDSENETIPQMLVRRSKGCFTPTSDECSADNTAYDKIYEYDIESDDDQNVIRPLTFNLSEEAHNCPRLKAYQRITIAPFNLCTYYQYWFTCNGFEETVATKFHEIYLNEEYDEESMMEDFEDMDDSVILSEMLEIYDWNVRKQQSFANIIIQLQPILVMYKEWHALFDNMSNHDFACYPCKPESQPCKHTLRVWTIMKFFQHWMDTVFKPMINMKKVMVCPLMMSDFLNSLPKYSMTVLQSDYQHLQEFHLCRKHFKRLIPVSYASLKWNSIGHEQKNSNGVDGDVDADETMVLQKKKSGVKAYLTIFEYFETTIDDCNAFECPAFERLYRARYDEHYDDKKFKLHAIPDGWKGNNKRIRKEIGVQKICDSIHNFLWHTSAKYSSMGMGESDEHRQLILLIASNRNKKWHH